MGISATAISVELMGLRTALATSGVTRRGPKPVRVEVSVRVILFLSSGTLLFGDTARTGHFDDEVPFSSAQVSSRWASRRNKGSASASVWRSSAVNSAAN